MKKYLVGIGLIICFSLVAEAQTPAALLQKLEAEAAALEQQVISWRREFHEHPELSNREFKTGKKLADMLRAMGLEVQYPVAKTGVVALLKGGKPGPVVALRADIDGLPVNERNGLPFQSKERVTYNNMETGVMHACGHDSHMAMMLGVATILSRHKGDLKGSVKFLFQPAEEGPPSGEEGGAALMVKEGVLENPKVDVVFGLHIQSLLSLGQIAYRAEGLMAAEDALDIKITGVGAHGATPWDSVDPIIVAAQVLNGLQTIVSRQSELTKAPVVLTIGSIHGGIRSNIIPEEVTMQGTIRTFDIGMQKLVHEKIVQTATKIAESAGARAEVKFNFDCPVVYNDPGLVQQLGGSLSRAANGNIKIVSPTTMAEDFSFFQEKVPGILFFVGANPADLKLAKPPVHHTADFMLDERAFVTGVKGLMFLTMDYMNAKK